MDPHRMNGSRSGAPGTFSITYGSPDASNRSRVAPIRSGWPVAAPKLPLLSAENAWHGGLAWIGVEPGDVDLQRVVRVATERVVRLRFAVDADHLEPGAVVAHCRAPGPAKQIE